MTDWTRYPIKTWAEVVFANAKSKGWYDGIDVDRYRDGFAPVDWILMRLSLVHSEVSEAVESVRKGEPNFWIREDGKPEGIGAELADVVIRCFDLAESLGIDIEAAIATKHAHNCRRPHRHGGKLA